MATSTYLSSPTCTINSVDLQDQCRAATMTVKYQALSAGSFGNANMVYTAGLGDHEFTVTLLMSYSATETYSTLAALVGTSTTVSIKPSSAATSATNPSFILTGAYLEELPVIDASYGELSEIDITFKGGAYTVAIV